MNVIRTDIYFVCYAVVAYTVKRILCPRFQRLSFPPSPGVDVSDSESHCVFCVYNTVFGELGGLAGISRVSHHSPSCLTCYWSFHCFLMTLLLWSMLMYRFHGQLRINLTSVVVVRISFSKNSCILLSQLALYQPLICSTSVHCSNHH